MALDSCQPIVHGLLKIEEGGKEKEVLNWSRCTDKQRFDNKNLKRCTNGKCTKTHGQSKFSILNTSLHVNIQLIWFHTGRIERLLLNV